MKFKKPGFSRKGLMLLSGCFIFSIAVLGQGSPATITEKDTREVLEFLASDKLKGRADFSNGQLEAAAYIENFFSKCRLEPYRDAGGFFHPFTTSDISEKKMVPNSISWNGKQLTAEQFYYSHELPEIKKLYLNNFRVVEAGETLSPGMISAYLTDDIPLLIWFNENPVLDSVTKHSLLMLKEVHHKKILIVKHAQRPQKIVIEADPFYKNNILFNVVGMIPGKSKAREIVIFSAHYDHVSSNPIGQRGMFNGANDNASGVTALLQLAKYFSQLGSQERTILFIAFAGEERGLLGSTVFAEQVNPDRIACMVNIEMIGKYNIAGKNSFFVTGQERSNFSDILSRYLAGTNVNISPAPKGREDLFLRSDNYPFYRKKIPAHSIMCSDDSEPCYHQDCDNADGIDYANMTRIIQSIAVSVTGLVNGTETPVNR